MAENADEQPGVEAPPPRPEPMRLNIKQAADWCGVSRSTISEYHKRGLFPGAIRDPTWKGAEHTTPVLIPVPELLAAGLVPRGTPPPPMPEPMSVPMSGGMPPHGAQHGGGMASMAGADPGLMAVGMSSADTGMTVEERLELERLREKVNNLERLVEAERAIASAQAQRAETAEMALRMLNPPRDAAETPPEAPEAPESGGEAPESPEPAKRPWWTFWKA